MRYANRLGGVALAFAMGMAVFAGDAGAVTVSFGDSVHYWDGYANGTGDDARDTIGTPNLLGGRAEIELGLLTRIEIDYTGPLSLATSGRGRVIPGDLFLDAGADGDWDYVVKLVSGSQMPVISYASLSILDVRDVSESYLMSGSDNSGHWRGHRIRDRHPYAWDRGGSSAGSASLDPFSPTATGTQTLGFHLGDGLALGNEFTIGFAVSCANDVLLETVSAPVPEPTAALLFAAGAFVVSRGGRRPRRA